MESFLTLLDGEAAHDDDLSLWSSIQHFKPEEQLIPAIIGQPRLPAAVASTYQIANLLPSNKRPASAATSTANSLDEDAEIKRQRNCEASARFRRKKKEKEQQLEKQNTELREECQELKKRISELEQENKLLRSLVVRNQ